LPCSLGAAETAARRLPGHQAYRLPQGTQMLGDVGGGLVRSDETSMQAETRTLTQLFQLDVRYLVPLYQRPYVWTQDNQWAPLWDDIETVANHLVEEGITVRAPSHFLGAIVIHQEDNPPGTPQQFMVIDGQQRLTTLQLLLHSAAQTADELGITDEGSLLRRLIYNDPLLARGDSRFRVWPTNVNRSAFRVVMREATDGDRGDGPPNEIEEAHRFFCEQVREWALAGDAGADAAVSRMEKLRVALSDLLKVVSIRLEDGDNPQVIFETLNARGTPLIALDLLKNALFLAAGSQQADTDRLYQDYWAPELDRDHWRQDRAAGRLFTKKGDLFLQYWLVAELAEPVPVTELFETFRDRVLHRATCPPMSELIPALCRDAAIVRGFDDASAGTPEKRFFDLLDLLDTGTLTPLALVLGRSPEVSPEQRLRAFEILESFVVRRLICGWTTKAYNRIAASLVADVKRDLTHADDVLRNRLAAETAPANRWPRDEDVQSVILEKDMYGQRRQDRLVMVLWRIEEHLRAEDPLSEHGLAPPQRLTLEHVIPQSWQEHWPLDESVEDPIAWRTSHLHRLGNLTLTSGPLNSSLSNGPWDAPDAPNDKRRSLTGHSLLKLNSQLAATNPHGFDEHSVDARGTELAKIICQVWPGPEVIEAKPEQTFVWRTGDVCIARDPSSQRDWGWATVLRDFANTDSHVAVKFEDDGFQTETHRDNVLKP
jgi:hypothetical protein